jgi:hypothetical protein
VAIGDYFIGGYCGYYINVYWWLLMAILLMVIGSYFVSGYWWLF